MLKKIIFCFFFFTFSLLSAQKPITLEDIWQKYTYRTQSVAGFNFLLNGRDYTISKDNKILRYDISTGELSKTDPNKGIILDLTKVGLTQIDGYTFSSDEQKILLYNNTESIYRHSFRANYYVWDTKTQVLTPLLKDGKQMNAKFSPKGDKVAFVKDNNIYISDLQSNKITQVTTDGKQNSIINGNCDWVYEEEFSLTSGEGMSALEWSPDGKRVAFLRFDESKVPEYSMQYYNDQAYPTTETFKYPKVGEVNSIVTAHIYDINSGKTVKCDTGNETDLYIPRIYWTKNPAQLCVFRLNRHQNEMELLLADATSGATKSLLKEMNRYYIETENTNLTFLEDGKSFLWMSDKDGFRHIYKYDMTGKQTAQLTKGNFDVTEIYGIDEKRAQIYYQTAEKSPMEREIRAVGLNGKGLRTLAASEGVNDAQFSSNFDFFVLNRSTFNSAATYTVCDNNGKPQRIIEENKSIKTLQQEYGTAPVSFFNFQTSENVTLNGWMLKPTNFDATKKYPVLMYVYGGPGSQQVLNRWKGQDYWWFQLLAQKGYIVACVDNRGTGARGAEFQKMTYQQLGKYETLDQIEAAKYLGKQPYIDAARIGIFGWSYGGYMSSLCILKGNDVFKSAIAVAPVTNWKWYDSVYTERFMRTTQENAAGYRENSPVYFADKLKGNYLLVHGIADDNVHFQNSAEMVNALVKANKQFDTYYYPNRNHGIYGGNTRLHLYTKMTNFLLEKL
jgi:dipeptidyl-peptidase 4